MNIRAISQALGALLRVFGAVMLIPALVAGFSRAPDAMAFGFCALLTILLGIILRHWGAAHELGHKESLAVVTLSWLAVALLGGLPFWLSGSLPTYVDGFFEAMSGITTAGATVFTQIEGVPKATILWRSLLHWLGGMGFVVFSVAVLPKLGVAGRQLFEAEVPGLISERLRPRIQQTARVLWGIYVGLTLLQVVLLMLGRVSFFEAIVHAFSTMGTGGFSSRNLSVESFQSGYVEMIIFIFMVIAGTNFAIHYRVLQGGMKSRFWRSEEFVFYLGTLVTASFLVAINLWLQAGVKAGAAVRLGSFQVASIMTTTGFSTTNFAAWPSFSRLVLLVLMFVGGSAGSTAGGIKVARGIVVVKHVYRELLRLIHPRAVRYVTLDGEVVDERVVQAALGFVVAYLMIFLLGTLAMAGFGLEPLVAVSCVATSLGNVGPGLAYLGPYGNFASLPGAAKILGSGLMLVGRLEIFTVLALFLPLTWRKRSQNAIEHRV